MSTPAVFLQGLHTVQIGIAAYGAYQSYVAITMLQGYESISKKAAEWSNEAQKQLDLTRSTQAAGALTIAASLVGAALLATIPQQLPYIVRFLASPALLLGTIFARSHITSFWGTQGGTQVKLPSLGDYNKAQSKTKEIIDILQILEYSWVMTAFGWGLLGA